jgi:uncharacterized membrane protein
MVLPVVASAFGAIYLLTRTEGMSKISARLTVIAALAMIGVWYTGSQAGPQIYDYLSEAGQHELVEHKTLGLYLAIAMGVIALLQFAGCQTRKFALQALAILLLFAATATTFLQGKDGGELVYNHGMPFKYYMVEDTLKEAVANAEEAEECDAKVEAYEDAIDDIHSISEDVNTIYGNPEENEEEEEDGE